MIFHPLPTSLGHSACFLADKLDAFSKNLMPPTSVNALDGSILADAPYHRIDMSEGDDSTWSRL